MLNRRKFLKNTLASTSAATTISALSAPALSQGRNKLTMVTTWGRGSAGVFDSALRIAEHVNAMVRWVHWKLMSKEPVN